MASFSVERKPKVSRKNIKTKIRQQLTDFSVDPAGLAPAFPLVKGGILTT